MQDVFRRVIAGGNIFKSEEDAAAYHRGPRREAQLDNSQVKMCGSMPKSVLSNCTNINYE